MSGLLHEEGACCPLCEGRGYLTEAVEERFSGHIDGPEPAATRWVGRVTSWTGLGPESVKARYPFSTRYLTNERVSLPNYHDGALIELRKRLHRQLVMGRDDGPGWYDDWIRERYNLVQSELAWRSRAAQVGAPRVEEERLAGYAAWQARVERVKERADLALLIAAENAGARKVGANGWRCCCPFHADRSPSLDIDTVKGLWLCRGCGVGGDAFTYVELKHGYTFADAVRYLESRL